jgi:Putative zinc-finger
VSHHRIAAALSDYLDGSLPEREASRVDAHLLECAQCRATLHELRRTVGLLRNLRGGYEAPDLSDSVMVRIRAGEARPSLFDRVRTGVARFLSGSLGAPLATAAVGLTLLAVLPRVEVEVTIPGAARRQGVATEPTRPPRESASRLQPASPVLLSRRVSESPGRDPFACLEAGSLDACREPQASLRRLADEDVWAFMAGVEEAPETRRDPWLAALSRFAARSGELPERAACLRASEDPQPQRMEVRFDEAR